MNLKTKILGAAIGALGMVGATTAAYAISVTPPSERIGLDLASPLPEGIYFVDVASLGGFTLAGGSGNGATAFNYDVPVIAWSTPWSIGGVHVEFLVAGPFAEVGTYHNGNSSYSYGIYNPYLGISLNYSFGNGFAVGYWAGDYLPMSGTAGFDPFFNHNTFHQMLAFSYHMNGWNFTSNFQYGIVDNTSGSPYTGANGVNYGQALFGDYFNYDLALTKTLGKWEVGMVGFGSVDTTATFVNSGLVGTAACAAGGGFHNHVGCGEQSEFALGGLVGYNFGPVITQLIVSSDVYIQNLDSYDTRGTLHVIVPLWNPPAPKVVTAKY